MADEGEDLPPPLEDMTEVINRISELKAKVDNHKQKNNGPQETRTISSQANNNSHNKSSNNSASQQTVKPKSQPTVQASSGACGFGGMKKGFLSGGLDTKKTATASNKVGEIKVPPPPPSAAQDNMPHIKSNPSKTGDHLVMQEVQRMRDQLQKTDAWLTEDLLNKLGNNDKLMTMMADPRCERALQEFQANPDKALLTYQHDKYIQEFFKEFCDVLGNHYENLSDASLGVAENVQSTPQTAPPTTERREELIKEVKTTRHTTPKTAVQTKKDSEEDARVKQVLNDPKLVEILQSPNIMELIRSLKEDPEKAQRLLQQGGKEFQEKVKVLVDAGLLAFQR